MSQVKQGKEPLLRIAKRDGISRPMAYGIRVIAVLLSLVVSGITITRMPYALGREMPSRLAMRSRGSFPCFT